MELTDFERFVAKICQWKTALKNISVIYCKFKILKAKKPI